MVCPDITHSTATTKEVIFDMLVVNKVNRRSGDTSHVYLGLLYYAFIIDDVPHYLNLGRVPMYNVFDSMIYISCKNHQ